VKARIRVAFVNVPPLLRQILEHAISRQPEFEILLEDVTAGPVTAAAPPPDAVILAAEDTNAAGHARMLLDRWPDAAILVFTRGGRRAALYRQRHRRLDLGQISALEAARAIRDAFDEQRVPDS
jgi:DNA-binding NarL/FixJ family response regulator